MAKPPVSDELWSVVEPLLPAPRPKKKDGRPRIPGLHRNRLLLVRYERRDDLHSAFLHLVSALICWHFAADLFC